MTPKKNKGVLLYVAVSAAIILGLLYLLNNLGQTKEDINYGEVMSHFDKLEVYDYTFNPNTGALVIRYADADDILALGTELSKPGLDDAEKKSIYDDFDLKKGSELKTTVPNVSVFWTNIEAGQSGSYHERYNVAYPDSYPVQVTYIAVKDRSLWISMIPTLLLLVGMVVLFVFTFKQANGGGKIGNFGKSNAKAHLNTAKKATFADVAGADEEKEELKEVVDFLKDSKKYNEIGARVPKGVLLLGPPGTGKTLLARAVAGEAGVPFFSISGSDFVEMFVGVGASRVRDLFAEAKKSAPAIIFIDEIDAVGRQRGAGLGGGHDEREQTLNQLLVEMDGFSGNEGIIVMAATNRRDILDPALLRPGRFDRQILVSYPDVKGREDILKVHTRNKPLAPDVSLETIAKSTVGFTGADLENLVNEAGLLAARKNRKSITKADMEEASIKVVAGPEKKSKVVTPKEKELTAYHEGGHAICTYYREKNDKVHQVSIIPRGGAGGFTMSLPEQDKSYVSKNEMKDKIVVLLGGRVAEKLVLDDISTGASNDLERATGIARSMVTRYGFSEKLGPVVYGTDEHEVFLGRDFNSSRNYSESVASEIDSEIRSLIEDGYQGAEDILTAHMDQLHFIAKYLIHFEKIDGKDFEKLMKGEMTEEIFANVEELSSKTGEDIGKNLDVTVTDSKEEEKSENAENVSDDTKQETGGNSTDSDK